jgi:protein-disulfide isomerase
VYATCLALCVGLAACTKPAASSELEAPEPETSAEANAEAKPSGGKAIKSDRRARMTELEPSEVQLDAGIPHLRFAVSTEDAASRGPTDAPITLVMFSDFECPYCTEAIHIVEELEQQYKGRLRFVYKAFPIDRHPYAMLAALIAYSARDQNKFWPFHDLLYSGRSLDDEVLSELRQGKRLDVRSTPTFFINGRPLIGAQPLSAFRQIIDQELELAETWQAEGVAKGDIYTHATEYGYTHVSYQGAPALDEDSVYPVPLGASPVRGKADAKLTVVAFSDFRCPFCTRGNETVERLKLRYGEDMRVIYKFLPFQGPAASSAALGAWAAGKQGKFWEFHDAMYERGPRFTLEDLELTAMRVGLDVEQWYRDVESEEGKQHIRADLELGKRLSITGTPTYFVNGRPLDGARSEFEFRLLFAEELERAANKLAAGVKAKDLYEVLSGIQN